MAGYIVKGAAVAARVAGSDRYFERGAVLPDGVENIGHLLSVGLVVEVVNPEPEVETPEVSAKPVVPRKS